MKWLKDKSTGYKIFLVVLALCFVYYGYSSGKSDLDDLPQAVQDSPLFAAFRAEYMYSPKQALLGDFNNDGLEDLAVVYSAGFSWKMAVVVGNESGEPVITASVTLPSKEGVSLHFDQQTSQLTLSATKKGATGLEDIYQLVGDQLKLLDSHEFNL